MTEAEYRRDSPPPLNAVALQIHVERETFEREVGG
jgi:hypothetical protein